MKRTNLGYLISMTDNNSKLINEMIEIFIEQVTEIGVEFEEAYRLKNYDVIANLAHKAKSSVGIMGMNQLSETLKELELLANEGKSTTKYPLYIKTFKEECSMAIDELIIFRNKLSS
jgi:HPt (histidine-containing phosphotransfer) domain-containing protein